MTECTQSRLEFPGFSRRRIEASFDGGDITGNGGAQLLRLADDRTRLIKSAARAIGDPRRRRSCAHDLESLIRQRVYAIALGHEDLNDHEALRSDLALQTIRRTALRGTALARAQCGTLRLKLLRIGAVVLRNTRRVRLLLSGAHPDPELFLLAAARLKPD